MRSRPARSALSPRAAALAVALAAAISPAPAEARKPRVVYQDARTDSPSAKYAAMDRAACTRALGARKIGFTALDKARGVAMPVHLTGPVGGVLFRVEGASAAASKEPRDVFDCRLVLALHDFARVLTARGIDLVVLSSSWRPPKRSWPAGKPATRHPGALAVDVKRFGKRLAPGETARRWLSIEADFRGRIGSPVCRPDGARALSPAAKELRAIACEAHDKRLFTSILTPNYDRAHRDHFHLELRPGVSWSLFL